MVAPLLTQSKLYTPEEVAELLQVDVGEVRVAMNQDLR